MLINHAIIKSLECSRWQPRYAYIAPFLKQAKLTTWTYWKWFTSTIPGRYVNESELYIELPGGKRIYLFGADNPDAIRGPYWDGVILDEYAQIKPNVYDEIVRPALADRKGWAVFSGTPKGQNQFLEVHQMAERLMASGDPNWYSCLYRADETGVIDAEELKMMRDTMPDSTYRQEMLCDFTASADNVLIMIDAVSAACAIILNPNDIYNDVRVLGVDPARFGDDRSSIIRRQGRQVFKPMVRQGIDLMQLVGLVVQEIDAFHPDAVFVDEGGMGAGVVDRLRQLGYRNVFGVNFGSRATNSTHYANKRTEIWDLMREYIETGGALPNDPDLKADLVSPTYSFDAHNKMVLETKDSIKKRGGRSPDIGDSLALTFSQPVRIERGITIASTGQQLRFANGGRSIANRDDYDPTDY